MGFIPTDFELVVDGRDALYGTDGLLCDLFLKKAVDLATQHNMTFVGPQLDFPSMKVRVHLDDGSDLLVKGWDDVCRCHFPDSSNLQIATSNDQIWGPDWVNEGSNRPDFSQT